MPVMSGKIVASMTETLSLPDLPVPYADYPILFGGHELPAGFEAIHTANREFIQKLIRPESGEEYSDLERLTVETCAAALTSADHRLGRDTGGLGTMCTEDEDGLWHTLPPFYHNGDGTRLAVQGTQQYIDFVNQLEGAASPFRDRETYLATMVTAAFDDVVFGAYGRGGDELASAALARTFMYLQGFPPQMIEAVQVGIESSIFDEIRLRQRYDPARGYEPVQRGSQVGDLWALGSPQCSMNSCLLLVENFWKRDLYQKHFQVLRANALNEFLAGWRPEGLESFLQLFDRYPATSREFGRELMNNRTFLTTHEYPDPRVNDLFRHGMRQNAALQELIGEAIVTRRMSVRQALHCTASYADGRAWLNGDRETAGIGELTPELISKLLLRRNTLDELRHPVNAAEFFNAYMAEHEDGLSAEGFARKP
jgi:hypothetical protein